MIELRVAPYCENCQKFYAVTDMHQQRIFGNDPLKPAGEVYTCVTVTCAYADRCEHANMLTSVRLCMNYF